MKEETFYNATKSVPDTYTKGYVAPRISQEYPDCALPFTFDQYKFCFFKCAYCFANYNKLINPNCKDVRRGEVKAVNVKAVERLFLGEKPDHPYYKHFIKKKVVLQWGSLADPFCPIEEKFGAGLELMKFFKDIKYPLRFSTKGTLCTHGKYLKFLKDNASELGDKWAFIYSIITLDEKIARMVEAGAPSPQERYNSLKILKDMGYFTGHRLRPFIIDISDKTLDEMLKMDIEVNVNAISTEFFCLDIRGNDAVKRMYKVMSRIVGYDMLHYYKKCSPANMGYYRLTPKLKEPFVKKMYEWALKNKKIFACSDPHYKELNTTGNCCGLPDDGSPLSNWQRFQWTNLIKILREKYWKGENATISWTEYINLLGKDHKWLKEISVGEPHFVGGYMNGHKTMYEKLFHKIRNSWNKPKSRASLYYYFFGKLRPIGLDENKDVIYQYIPSSYEETWAKWKK